MEIALSSMPKYDYIGFGEFCCKIMLISPTPISSPFSSFY